MEDEAEITYSGEVRKKLDVYLHKYRGTRRTRKELPYDDMWILYSFFMDRIPRDTRLIKNRYDVWLKDQHTAFRKEKGICFPYTGYRQDLFNWVCEWMCNGKAEK
ncbi:MAG: hypothetical protein PQJ59_16880 [Spirochaetales bacterium]|nr:hypothetical protein [Spirochaetales bacterium]